MVASGTQRPIFSGDPPNCPSPTHIRQGPEVGGFSRKEPFVERPPGDTDAKRKFVARHSELSHCLAQKHDVDPDHRINRSYAITALKPVLSAALIKKNEILSR